MEQQESTNPLDLIRKVAQSTSPMDALTKAIQPKASDESIQSTPSNQVQMNQNEAILEKLMGTGKRGKKKATKPNSTNKANKPKKEKALKATNEVGEIKIYHTIPSLKEELAKRGLSTASSVAPDTKDNVNPLAFTAKLNFGGVDDKEDKNEKQNNQTKQVTLNLFSESPKQTENTQDFGLMSIDALNQKDLNLNTSKSKHLTPFDEQNRIAELKDENGLLPLDLPKIQELTYLTLLNNLGNCITLDISVKSTGWLRKIGDRIDLGAYHINADTEDLKGRRDEFNLFLKNLAGDEHYDFILIEDVIGSVNFKTARILYQLNPLADDLVSLGEIKADKIVRKDNKKWKKSLKKASNYKSPYSAYSDDKQIIRDCLYLLGFGDRTTNVIIEDMYDAMGLTVSYAFELSVGSKKAGMKLKDDINKGYNIKQFTTEIEALDYANKRMGYIQPLDFSEASRDLTYNFKKYITEAGEDTLIYVITIPTNRIGVLAIKKEFDLTCKMSYIVAWRKK